MDRITSPAERVILKCGNGNLLNGLARVSGWTGIHLTRVRRWTYPRERGGTGGLIPTSHQQTILMNAVREGVVLEPSDFFFTTAELAPPATFAAGAA